jgi:hypothetical protein
MIATDKTALICDLAETYHIYDLRPLSFFQIAAFSSGLRDDSRIKLKMSGQPAPLQEVLEAAIVDRLTAIISILTGDKKQQDSLVEILYGTTDDKKEKNTQDAKVFDSPEDFEQARREIFQNIKEQDHA